MSGSASDWELDYYSRPLQDPEGRRRWELLICSADRSFQWQRFCPADSVNSFWLNQALSEAMAAATAASATTPRRLRCWRSSMRTMVQRAAEPLGLVMVPSRRCFSLQQWLLERQAEVYPAMEGHMVGPLAPPAQPLRASPLPLPDAVRGDSWSWASLPAASLEEADQWPIDFAGLVPLPVMQADAAIPGLRLFSPERALALAGWLSGLEPVRLEVQNQQLVLEAGLEDRWLVSDLDGQAVSAAEAAFSQSRQLAGGMQFLAVQTDAASSRFHGFWLLRDLADD
jgi:hypothetical protein